MIVASAPSKLVLCGEYVVLDGAPAIGMALSARATVTLTRTSGDSHRLRCPGYADGEFRFTSNRSSLEWQSGGDQRPDLSLFESMWNGSGTGADLDANACFDIIIDSSAFRDANSGIKLGLGSSAAVAVALAGALAKTSGRTVALADVIAMHRKFQAGKGSGVDIATSWHGGVVSYSMPDLAIEIAAWPEGLFSAVFWSGHAANTSDKITAFSEASTSDEQRLKLQKAGRALVEQWSKADADTIELLLARYAVQLKKFDAALGLGIFAAGHAAMFESAEEYGVVYKPCGAGGGDIGIALSCNEDNLQNFASAAQDLGFRMLDLSIDELGLAVGDDQDASAA